MNSRLHKNFTAICLIIMSTILTGCQDTIPKRGLISDGAASGSTTGGSGGGSVERPDGAVKFKADFCGCKNGAVVVFGNNCAVTCANKPKTDRAILYVAYTVTDNISLNQSLQNINGWCNANLANDGVDANAVCVVKAKDELNTELTLNDVKALSTANTMSIDIDELPLDKAYILTLVETSSGAKSDSIQIIKYSPDLPLQTLGPLKNAPITQYSCINRPQSIDNDTGDIYYDAAFRVHFYFLPGFPPDPIAPNQGIFCHDIVSNGSVDNILYPRLEQISGIFNLWDSSDPRFYDTNGNSYQDINDIIIQKTKNFSLGSSGGTVTLPASTRFFQEFPLLTTTAAINNAGGNASTAQSMGWYMAPWIDGATFKSYCLNSTHYSSDNPLFKAMRDVVGVDMEGLYVGVKAAESVLDQRSGNMVTAPADFLLIRETDLKSVWFYLNGNVPTVPTDANVASKAVYFYYPLNPAAPYVRGSTQKLYQVKGAKELNNSTVSTGGSNSSGVSTDYPPHDRKIGCVPKF